MHLNFVDALETIKPLIVPVDEPCLFLSQLEMRDIIDKKPKEVLELLDAVYTNNWHFSIEALRNIMSRLLCAQSTITEDLRCRKINDFLLQYQ